VKLKLSGEEPAAEGFERVFRRKDGSTFPVMVNDRLLKRADGVITGIRTAIQDITERKQAEKHIAERTAELAKERLLLRTLLDNLPDIIFAKDTQSRFTAVNAACAHQLGADSVEDVLGKTDADFVSPELSSKYLADEQALMKSGRPVTKEEPTQHKMTGEMRLALTTKVPLKDDAGKVIGLIGIARDITELKRAEGALRDSEAFLNTVIESIPHMIFVKDAKELRFVKFNKAGQDMLGYSLPDLIGKNDYDFFPKEMAGHFTENDRQVLEGKAVVDIPEEIIQTRNEGERILHTKKIPVFDNAGHVIYLMGISEDITGSKKAERALLESQALYHSLVEQMPACVFRKNQEGRYVFVNSRFCQLRGMKEDEILGKTPVELIAALVKSGAMTAENTPLLSGGTNHHAQIMRSGETIEVEETWPANDGREHVFHVVKSPVYAADGKITGTQGVQFDITALKQADKALRESQVLYHSLVENIPTGVFRKDREGRYVFANSIFCRLKGLKADEILGKTPRELDAYQFAKEAAKPSAEPPRQRTLVTEGTDHHELIIRTGKVLTVEEVYPQPDGTVEYFHAVKSPVFAADGRIIGSQGMLFDITELKQAEAALRQERDLLNNLTISIPDHIYFKDRQSRFVRINGPMARHFKLRDPSEAIGKTDFDMFSNEHAQKAFDDEQRIMATGEPIIGLEEKETWPDGHVTWVSTTKVAMHDETGKITGLVGVSRDVTGHRQLEEQYRQSQKMEAIGQLAGGVAHDFNNILAVIQMQADLLKTEVNPTPSQLESARDIGAAAQRAAALTRQLLLFSRKETVLARDLDLNEAIGNMTKMLRRILGEDIQTQFNFALQPVFIHADPGMMDQVLMNLAVNARDAMPDGGRLMIETAAVEFDKATASRAAQGRPGSYVCLSVSDTGCGIPAENLTRIFEPFFTTKDVGKGTGLGLAVLHGIVEQHKGWVEVQSEVGHGTTFRVYLPRLVEMSGQKAEQGGLASMPRGDETILLVEDDAFLRVSVGKVLTQLGYRVVQAVNGVEALKVWKERRGEIDLVLTDLVMPEGMNGKEMVEEMLKDEPGLDVVYTSGYSDEVAGRDSGFVLREGVNFLSKPFHAHKLAQTIRAKLDG
jgi:PAS domain S-box-containing protein